MLKRYRLPKILPAPERPATLSPDAKWLSGEGAGSWFVINRSDSPRDFHAVRYSPEGMVECKGRFIQQDVSNEFFPEQPFEITYPSSCKEITIVQHQVIFRFVNGKGNSTNEKKSG